MNATNWRVTRRDFLRATGVAAAALCGARATAASAQSGAIARIGLVTDPHFADIATHGSRHYRESLEKMHECVTLMNEKGVDFLVELGDFTNGAEKGDTAHLAAIEAIFGGFEGPRYHVLGNHDLDSLSKEAFQAIVENTGIAPGRTYYSFDHAGLHVVVLDANFNPDGSPYDTGNFHWADANIPEHELAWLDADLAANALPAVVCCHQLLDMDEGQVAVRNASAVREILERCGNVLAVFQGHHHAGQHNEVAGIHYYTLKAMVEGSGADNSAYAVAEVFADGGILVTGYRRADSMVFDGAEAISAPSR